MKPYLAVQGLLRCNKVGKPEIAGSTFRLWSSNHFITASHCVQDIEPAQLKIMNPLNNNHDLNCVAIHRHSKADIAVVEVEGPVPERFQKFKITRSDFSYGAPIHCFGIILDWEGSTDYAPARVIGGIIQRDFIYDDSVYKSPAFELSTPIPKGMSGGPAFLAVQADVAIGIAIATIKSEVVISSFEECENDEIKTRERISEITRYGVVLRLYTVRDWLEEIIPKEGCT